MATVLLCPKASCSRVCRFSDTTSPSSTPDKREDGWTDVPQCDSSVDE